MAEALDDPWHPSSAARSRSGATMLLERDGALDAIARAVERTRGGKGGALLVEGEAGLGKSTLLERAVGQCGDFRVGAATGTAPEAGLPFGLLSLALTPLGGRDALEKETAADAGEARASRFFSVLQSLTNGGDRTPTLIVLDDLHWADPDTLDLVAFLVRRLQNAPVLVVGAFRPWPPTAARTVAELVRAQAAELVELAPISLPGTLQLLEAMLGPAFDERRGEELWRACSGNPLLLEVAAATLGEGRVIPEGSSPRTMAERMLISRFAGIGDTALRYVQSAAVLGVEFRPQLAGLLAGFDPGATDRALATLCAAGLVQRSGPTGNLARRGKARFTHPLFAHALYTDLPEPVRDRMHEAAFRLLLEQDLDPADAARHAVEAGLIGDHTAIDLLTNLGQSALRRGAVGTAVEHLDHAVDLAGDDAEASLLLTWAQALVVTGRVKEAGDACRRVVAGQAHALEGSPGLVLADALRHRAWTEHLEGALGQALEHLRSSAAVTVSSALAPAPASRTAGSEDCRDPTTALRILLDCAHTTCLLAGPARALDMAEHAALIAAGGDQRLVESTVAYRRFIQLLLAKADPCDEADLWEIESAVHGAGLTVDPSESVGGWGPLFARLNVAKLTEHFDDAEAIFERAHDAAQRMGSPIGLVTFDVTHADTLARLGRLPDALALLDRTAIWSEFTPMVTPWTMALRAGYLVELGRYEEATACCDTLDTFGAPFTGYLPLAWLWQWMARTRLLLDAGRSPEASDLALLMASTAEEAGLLEPYT
ncbi:MAG: AAA family ATPase, partial [Actinomycetota bacterium]|nr:AAA family ATPase [Actinomycetota bacterium]